LDYLDSRAAPIKFQFLVRFKIVIPFRWIASCHGRSPPEGHPILSLHSDGTPNHIFVIRANGHKIDSGRTVPPPLAQSCKIPFSLERFAKRCFRTKIQTAEKQRLRRRAERKQLTSKLSEQSIRVLEIPRVKAFRKAAVGGTKDIERFGAVALIHPEPGQVGCRAKLK